MLTAHLRRPAIARSGMVSRRGFERSEQPLPSLDITGEEIVFMLAVRDFDFANSRIDLYSVAKCGLVTLCE